MTSDRCQSSPEMKLSSLLDSPIPRGFHYWMFAVTALLFALVAAFVDLKPVVDESFFFSSRDPSFRQASKIDQRFPSSPELILAVSSHDISSPHYLSRIARLTHRIREIDEVTTVRVRLTDPRVTRMPSKVLFGAGC